VPISVKTHKILWGRSGNRCAFPDCEQRLVEEAGTVGPVVGDEAHIVARELEGPRGNPPLPTAELDTAGNLLLLCPTHHRIIDSDPDRYTVAVLQEMKRVHEDAVAAAETANAQTRRLHEETYAEWVDEWIVRADLDHWNGWASRLVTSGQPSLDQQHFDALDGLRHWLLGRVWPGSNAALESSFLNFRLVLNDLVTTFESALEYTEGPILWTRKYYKIPEWNPRAYHRLLDSYKRHVALVENLAFELTRAANFVCDTVRDTLEPRFRIDEGALLLTTGLYDDFTFHTYRLEYNESERTATPPYPGPKGFAKVGPKRDHWVRETDF
jgi:hypothetical protein